MGIDYSVFNGLKGAIAKGGTKNRGPVVDAATSSATIQRKKRIAPKSKHRDADKAKQDGPQAAMCRRMPCFKCAKEPIPGFPTQAHHEPPRSLGGLDEDCTPLCSACHEIRNISTPGEFWLAVGANPDDVKAYVREAMEAENQP